MGRVIFIGAGPGAGDLITVRGARRLAQAQVVLVDALVDPALRELAPAARWVSVGKRGYSHSTGQAAINALLIKHASKSEIVVRLKGGDPSVFGRLEEEIDALAAAGIECEVVPGVTAALAAAAATQRPLTRRGRGRSVSLSTAMTIANPQAAALRRPSPVGIEQSGRATFANERPQADDIRRPPPNGAKEAWGGPALPCEQQIHARRSADTEVFYMAGRQLAALARRLLGAGWAAATPVSVVSRAGWPDELQSDHLLEDLGQASLLHSGRPSVVIVGAGAAPLIATLQATPVRARRIDNHSTRVATIKP